jgi:hypothetical protein
MCAIRLRAARANGSKSIAACLLERAVDNGLAVRHLTKAIEDMTAHHRAGMCETPTGSKV